MSDENKDTELSRVSSELATAKIKLDEERRKREEDLNKRLDSLDAGQKEILIQIGDVKLTYATAIKLDKLETRVDAQARLIYMAIGGLIVLQAGIGVALHFWK